jgi:hypothetical protein
LDAPDALGVLEKALQKTEEQIELWQDSNAKASKEWSDSDARAKALQSQVNAKKVAEIDRAYTGINEKLTQQGMQTLNLKFDVATLGREIDRMEIGKYVAAKMALMLNSQAFCDSKVRCEEPKDKATKKVGSEQLKELFPGGGMDIFSNVDFWQESRNNRGADKNAATSGAK